MTIKNEFTSINAIGKFDHHCSLEKTTFQLVLTPSSCKVICIFCKEVMFYRRETLKNTWLEKTS